MPIYNNLITQPKINLGSEAISRIETDYTHISVLWNAFPKNILGAIRRPLVYFSLVGAYGGDKHILLTTITALKESDRGN